MLTVISIKRNIIDYPQKSILPPTILVTLSMAYYAILYSNLIRLLYYHLYLHHNTMTIKILFFLILMIVPFALAHSFTPKTVESLTKSFNKYDQDQDGILTKKELRKYFDKEYLKDFQGIDIDPKFIESSFNYIYKADKDNDGLELEQFVEIIMPKKESNRKTQPQYYDEQDL